jgi:hypothetical protein
MKHTYNPKCFPSPRTHINKKMFMGPGHALAGRATTRFCFWFAFTGCRHSPALHQHPLLSTPLYTQVVSIFHASTQRLLSRSHPTNPFQCCADDQVDTTPFLLVLPKYVFVLELWYYKNNITTKINRMRKKVKQLQRIQMCVRVCECVCIYVLVHQTIEESVVDEPLCVCPVGTPCHINPRPGGCPQGHSRTPM